MCGIVGAIAERNIVPILMEGLRRLEYRGYDSAGLAVLNGSGSLVRLRAVGKVRALEEAIEQQPTRGKVGIAHTRWATHGAPSERNAHPHVSHDGLAIVHNGIIENHVELRADLTQLGYKFMSETDTEVIAHRIHFHMRSVKDLFKAVRATVAELEGAYALAVVSEQDPDRLIVAREGCPVVLGLGVEENFVASDVAALLPVTRRFVFLEEGDVAEVRRNSYRILDRDGNGADRPARDSDLSADAAEKGQYRHFMLKEIHEQPRAVANTLQERVANGRLLEAAFGRPQPRHSSVPSMSTLSPAEQASMRAWQRATSSNRSANCPAPWKSQANTATAIPWCREVRCSSRSRNPVKPPTPWRRCDSPVRRTICPPWRSATHRKARWCVNRHWSC